MKNHISGFAGGHQSMSLYFCLFTCIFSIDQYKMHPLFEIPWRMLGLFMGKWEEMGVFLTFVLILWRINPLI